MGQSEYMNKFHDEYNKSLVASISAINEGINIIICGHEGCGKSHMYRELSTLLKHNNYKCYIDMDSYIYDMNFNGKTYMDKVFIQVRNKDKIGCLLIDYEFIDLHIRHPSIRNKYKIKTPGHYKITPYSN
tara:strand:+ start:125 stop:514 length:390 start_codon:yes stop_codon:yes gene_type:complete